MNFLLVAHGTRKQRGVSLIGDLAAQVSAAVARPVHVAFVDVLGPTPRELLGATRGQPTVLVPAFLARGYHVSADIPAHVQASGHRDVTITGPLGPDPQLIRVLVGRLVESGWRPDDSVLLAAAGTSDPAAMRDLHTTATWLSATIGSRVELAFAATGEPRVADAVEVLRGQSRGRRVVVASYLLSEGLFQDRLRNSGAEVVTDPLGTHPGVARLITSRFLRARAYRRSAHGMPELAHGMPGLAHGMPGLAHGMPGLAHGMPGQRSSRPLTQQSSTGTQFRR